MKKEYKTPSVHVKTVNITTPIAASIPVGGTTDDNEPKESKSFEFIGNYDDSEE